LVAILFAVRIVLPSCGVPCRTTQPNCWINTNRHHEALWANIKHHAGPMNHSPSLPPIICHSVPAVMAVDMILYRVAHFVSLSHVRIDASLVRDQIRIMRFMEFFFLKRPCEPTRDGGNEMALMIIVFSGV
jgi:hypothetical protein